MFEGFALDPVSAGMGLIFGVMLAAGVLGWKLTHLAADRAALAARLESERAALGEHFQALARQTLESNSESFLRLARQRLEAAQEGAKADFDKRSEAIKHLVDPVHKNLELLKGAVERLQGSGTELQAGLSSLSRETARLAGALRNPAAQGRWGEFVLERLLDKANLMKGVHYETQKEIAKGKRPDVIVHINNQLKIVVDAKTPINEFVARMEDVLDSAEISDIEARLAQQVRTHVKSLGGRGYWEGLENVDFTVLFLPSEQVFSAVLRADPDIADFAADNNVVIASPTIMISLLRVVGLGWRQVELAQNAQQIAALGADLYKRLGKFTEHLGKIGKGLGTAINSYNDALGSLDRTVLPAARKFKKLHGAQQASLAEPSLVEGAPRALTFNQLLEDGEDMPKSEGTYG